jgi:hypothetical protein
MRELPHMRRLRIVLLPIGLVVAVVVWFAGWFTDESIVARLERCGRTRHDQPPQHVGTVEAGRSGDQSLQPYALCFSETSLYVTYVNSGRVDVFNHSFELQRRLDLGRDAASMISGIAVDDRYIYVADYGNGELRFYDHDGVLEDAYSWLPGKQERVQPFGLALHDGVLYVPDPGLHQLLAIMARPDGKPSEVGELLFHVPAEADTAAGMLFPSSAMVTPDGRILVSDMRARYIHVFTCSGRRAGSIHETGLRPMRSPHALAMDDLPSDDLLDRDRQVFDPSAVLTLGRIHVVDREAREVVVFNAVGEYVLRYGVEHLGIPNGIAINQKQRSIVIADSKHASLHVFRY